MINIRNLDESILCFAGEDSQTSTIEDIESYFKYEKIDNPINEFQNSFVDLIKYAKPEVFNGPSFIGRLLVVNLVSYTESYIKSVISELLKICPISLESSCKKSINIASILWGGEEQLKYSAFENDSVAAENSIIKNISTYLSINIEKDSDCKSLLSEFEKICQMRHGIVHCSGILAPKNAICLQIPKPIDHHYVKIYVGYKEFQDAALIARSLVFLINRKLFEEFSWRWVKDWRLRSDWIESNQYKIIRKYFSILHFGKREGYNFNYELIKTVSHLKSKLLKIKE